MFCFALQTIGRRNTSTRPVFDSPGLMLKANLRKNQDEGGVGTLTGGESRKSSFSLLLWRRACFCGGWGFESVGCDCAQS